MGLCSKLCLTLIATLPKICTKTSSSPHCFLFELFVHYLHCFLFELFVHHLHCYRTRKKHLRPNRVEKKSCLSLFLNKWGRGEELHIWRISVFKTDRKYEMKYATSSSTKKNLSKKDEKMSIASLIKKRRNSLHKSVFKASSLFKHNGDDI